jgi:2-polyprenyl-6-hydroxyphenyl methylase/3-demethylubiquinone-9 3-methyltransferase
MPDDAAGAYYDEYWSRDAPPPLADPLSGTRARLLGRALAEARAQSVLDAGAGAGDLVAALRADGRDAVGMDISPAAVGLARARHPDATFLVHSVEEVPWPVEDGSLDCVVAFEVIEHLLRPRRLLEGAARALRPGGHVALTTPYHGPVKNLALTALAFDRHFAVEGDHVRFFSDAALRRLLRETGFEPVRLEHFGRAPLLWAGVFAWARRA